MRQIATHGLWLVVLAGGGLITQTHADAPNVSKHGQHAYPANGPRNVNSTGELIQNLLFQGVSRGAILGIDEHGIPVVCGTDGDHKPGPPATGQRGGGLPAGTRGWECIPGVVRDDGAETFRLEVDVNGPVTRVTLEEIGNLSHLVAPEPFPFDLHDDGLGQDRAAGDFVFTSGLFRFDTATPLPIPEFFNRDPESPRGLFLTWVGTISVEEEDGTINQFLLQPEIAILRSDIPAVSTLELSPDIVVTPHLINIRSGDRATQRLLRASGTFFVPDLTARIYQVLPDEIDFFMFFSTNKIERVPRLTASNFHAGIHGTVQVDYTGGTSSLFDNAGSYGSCGGLLGVNAMDTYGRGIYAGNATHELVHQWAARVSSSLGLSQGSHYISRSSVGSMVGGLLWTDNADGTFTINCDEGTNHAHHAALLDKYMMGLIEPGEVPTLYAYSEESPYPIQKCANEEPVTPDEIVATVEVDLAIIKLHGPRLPGPPDAQRDFVLAFVAESHERLLNPTEITFYEILAEHYTAPVVGDDPYVANGWVSIDRYFGAGTSWSSLIHLMAEDCNSNGVPDDCGETDCNANGVPDECEIDENSTAPGGPFFCTGDCDPDCNNNGVPDECEQDIPTVSEWGLIVVTLLAMTLGTIMIGRRHRAAPA